LLSPLDRDNKLKIAFLISIMLQIENAQTGIHEFIPGQICSAKKKPARIISHEDCSNIKEFPLS
jgi:hypothetical protein